MNAGWIKLYRKILDNPIHANPSWLSVWVHLLVLASHEGHTFIWNGQKRDLKPGQLLTGRLQLATLCGVSQTTVERVLSYLETEHQIGQQKTTKYRVITIINWDKYQGLDNKTDNKKTTDGQQTDNKKTHTRMYKNEKKDKKETPAATAASPKKDQNEPVSLQEFVEKTKADKRRPIQIIGDYADQIRPDFKTRGEWERFLRRNLRPAGELAVFSPEQIEKAYGRMEKDMRTPQNPKGFLTRWTLETLLKYITNHV